MKIPDSIKQLFKRPAAEQTRARQKPTATTRVTTPVVLVNKDHPGLGSLAAGEVGSLELPPQAKPDTQAPIEDEQPISRRVPGTKRQRQFERQVQRAKKAIVAGTIKPQARPVSELCGCARRTALSILAVLTTRWCFGSLGKGLAVEQLRFLFRLKGTSAKV